MTCIIDYGLLPVMFDTVTLKGPLGDGGLWMTLLYVTWSVTPSNGQLRLALIWHHIRKVTSMAYHVSHHVHLEKSDQYGLLYLTSPLIS